MGATERRSFFVARACWAVAGLLPLVALTLCPATAARAGGLPSLEEAVGRAAASPQAALALVRGRIAYRPYRGFLKGPRGAWWDGTANAADAADLLADVLRGKRIKTRFAFGTLPNDKVTALLQSVFRRGTYPKKVQDKLPGKKLADPVNDPKLRAVAAEHVWVQAQKGGQWVDLDPVVLGLKVGQAATKPARTSATVADKDRRRLVIEVFATLKGHKPRRVLHTEQTVGALVGQRVVLMSVEDAPKERGRRPQPARLRPVLVIGPRPLQGTLYGGPRAAPPRHPAGRLGDIFGTVDRKPKAPEPAVEDVFVQLTLTGAGLPDRTQRRYLHMAGPGGIDRLEDMTTLAVVFGAPPRRVVRELADDAAAKVKQTKGVVLPATGPLTAQQRRHAGVVVNGTMNGTASMALALAACSHGMLRRLDEAFGTLSDYADARVMGITVNPRQERLCTDLLFDWACAWPRPGAKTSAPRALAWTRGLLESDLEGATLAAICGKEAPGKVGVLTVRSVFGAAAKAGIKPVALSPKRREPLARMRLPRCAARILAERLDAGRLVVVPERPVPIAGRPDPVVAWFEADPSTCRWVGVFQDGRHPSTTERKVLGAVVMVIGWVGTYHSSALGTRWTYSSVRFGLAGKKDEITGEYLTQRQIHDQAIKEAKKTPVVSYLVEAIGAYTVYMSSLCPVETAVFIAFAFEMVKGGHSSALDSLESHAPPPDYY